MKWNDFFRSQRGAAAAEFAMVVIPFVGIVMSGVGLCFMYWANSTIKYAVEDAARCASIRTTICTDANSTQSYAQSHYTGPDVSPVFTAKQNSDCGASSWTVSATASFPLNTGLVDLSIPLSAHACFPSCDPIKGTC